MSIKFSANFNVHSELLAFAFQTATLSIFSFQSTLLFYQTVALINVDFAQLKIQ